jgi:TldD protein
MHLIESAPRILQRALSRGGEFGEIGEIYFERRFTSSITCEANKIEQVVNGTEHGAGIRVIHRLKTAYAYTNQLTPNALLDLASRVSCAVGNGADGEPVIAQLVHRDYKPRDGLIAPNEVPTSGKVSLVAHANQLAYGVDGRIRQVKVVYGDVVQRVSIVNSEGLCCSDERWGTVFMVLVVAAAGDVIQTGYELRGGSRGYKVDERLVEEVAETAARRAVLMLDAKPAPAGTMTVVLSGKAGGTMVHEAIGHGLEADLAQAGLSVYSGRLGEQVASSAITVIDDSTRPCLRGSYSFDDEGVPAQSTILVEKGMLKGYMYDRLSALKDGTCSSGNGRRQSYQHHPIPRMSNTFIAPGEDDPEAIIRSVSKGLLVTSLGGGQVNTVNGDFVFEVNEGYLIEGGQVTSPVRGASLTGNGPEVLTQVEAVGNDLGFTIGTCGKDGQFCPCADAQPSLLIPRIVVGGTS